MRQWQAVGEVYDQWQDVLGMQMWARLIRLVKELTDALSAINREGGIQRPPGE